MGHAVQPIQKQLIIVIIIISTSHILNTCEWAMTSTHVCMRVTIVKFHFLNTSGCSVFIMEGMPIKIIGSKVVLRLPLGMIMIREVFNTRLGSQ